jgi:hypothetical protein
MRGGMKNGYCIKKRTIKLISGYAPSQAATKEFCSVARLPKAAAFRHLTIFIKTL